MPALVLGGIMEKRGDRLVLASARLQGERGNSEQMREIGDVRSLALLSYMNGSGVD